MEKCNISVKGVLKNSFEAVIYKRVNRIYLKKRFRERLGSDIRIFVNRENKRELLIYETGEGVCKKVYQSKKITEEILRSMNRNTNTNFVFFYYPEEKVWKGKMILDWRDSYLWENWEEESGIISKEANAVSEKSYIMKKRIVYKMFSEYRRLVELEEVGSLYDIAYSVVKNNYDEKSVWQSIILCLKGLLRELLKVQRKISNSESRVSLNRKIDLNNRCEILDTLGEIDYNFKNIEIEEFKAGLSEIERMVLGYLESGKDLENNISLGAHMKALMVEARKSIQKKACDYWGKSVIRSYGYSIKCPSGSRRTISFGGGHVKLSSFFVIG